MVHGDVYTRLILEEIGAGRARSQRSLAQHLDIALGRANSLVRVVVAHGWVRSRPEAAVAQPYALTPAGRRQLNRLTRQHLHETVAVYASTRQRLVKVLASVSSRCPATAGEAGTQKRVAFYGSGDVAEIGYAALRHTDSDFCRCR